MNHSKKYTILLLTIIFFLMLGLNLLTPMYLDDYAYSFSWATGERITGISQIFSSMRAHASIMNGRLFCHFLVQLSLFLPHIIFKLVNTCMFISLLWLLKKICDPHGQLNFIFYLLIFVAVWYFTPAFGQVMLWQDGSINYLWSAVFSLLFLYPYYFLYSKKTSTFFERKYIIILFCIYSVFVGGYSEVSAFSVIGGAILFLLVSFLFDKRKPTFSQLLPILFAFTGFALMMSAPAERTNKTEAFLLVDYINHFMNETEMYYTRLFPLIAAWIVLFILSVSIKTERNILIQSVCFLLISLASNYILITATFYPDRVMLMCTLYLIISCGVLIVPLLKSKNRLLILCGTTVFGLISCYSLLWGCYDVYRSYNIISKREAYIAEQKEKNCFDIITPYVDPWTKYSVTFEMEDLDPDDATGWPNEYVALYYGLDSIMGCIPD